MDLKETKVDSTRIYDGVIVKLDRDTAQLSNGKLVVREAIRHPGGVIILPIDDEGYVYMVNQFRYPVARTLLEIPAGKLEYGEDPLEGAKRELSEEVGATAARWTGLGKVLPTPGYCDEVHHLYLARGLSFGDVHPDEDEFLEQIRLPFEDACAMAADGRLEDGKTVIALLRAKLRMEESC